MTERIRGLIERLAADGGLSVSEYAEVVRERDAEAAELLRGLASERRIESYGRTVFVRGLIEISNICKNDCLYCGIRRSNKECERYRLDAEAILGCARHGYELGFRTFVLQGGEDGYFTDERLVEIVKAIKREFPDCAVTLSMGERSRESYERLYAAGADRYLLRHETATREHYEKLHPGEMSFDGRMRCLADLREIGFQTGCGFMVGSPYQTAEDIGRDLKFIEEFKPQMCGVGPFLPHRATPFADFAAGSVELTCYLLSIIRLILPTVLLPATTALGTAMDGGRELGILSGANVVMPNLSPVEERKKYELYNGKLHSGSESAEALRELEARLSAIGYTIDYGRGDAKNYKRRK